MSDRLLYALSAKGDVQLGLFDEMFGEIFKKNEVEEGAGVLNQRREMVRAFDSLGHCEIDYNDRRIYVCPPAIALLPTSGLPSGVLTGARSPKQIKQLKDFVRGKGGKAFIRVIFQRFRKIEMPSAIFIDCSDFDTIKDIAVNLGFDLKRNLPVAWDLAEFSSNIAEVNGKLNFKEGGELDWPRQSFNPKSLFFDRGLFVGPKESKLVCYINPINQQRLHRLWQGTKSAEIDRDWGRYIFLSEVGSQVILYDKHHFKLGVPSTAPLPGLLARALTLCTGLLPTTFEISTHFGDVPAGHPITVYSGVIPEVASIIGEKLGQNILDNVQISDLQGRV